MKKTRKILSLFAILFALVFALSVCFFAACGNKDEDETTTPEVQDEGAKEDDTTVTPNPDPDPNPDPNPEPEARKAVTVTSEDVELGGVTFTASAVTMTSSVSEDGGTVTYTLSGTAGVMTGEQANAFWEGVAAEGDLYVIITITLEEGETVSWTASDGRTKSYTYDDLKEDGGVLDIVTRISGKLTDGSDLNLKSNTYTIADEDGNSVDHVVSYEGVEAPKEEDTGDTKTVTKNYNYSIDDLKATALAIDGTAIADKDYLKAEYFAESNTNSFITLLGESSAVEFRNNSGSEYIETEYSSLAVWFYGRGDITITFASTGNDNYSYLGLYHTVGTTETYLTASATSGASLATGAEEETTIKQEDKILYSVKGTSSVSVKYTIEEPGQYIIYSLYQYDTSERGCRLHGISMTDTYDEDAHVHSFTKTQDTTLCGVAGEKTYVCADCPDSESYVVSSLATGKHTYTGTDAISVTTEPTETEAGEVTFTCDVCGAIEGCEGGVTTEALPALQNSAYTRTQLDDGEGHYVYVASNGLTVEFDSTYYEELSLGESFVSPNMGYAENEEIASNAQITTNSLFTITSAYSKQLKYTATKKDAKFTDIYNTERTAKAGFTNSSSISREDGSHSGKESMLTITAGDEKITLYVYASVGDSSYNSARSGYVYYTVDGGSEVMSDYITSIGTVVTLEITLEAGSSATIGAYIDSANSNNSAYFWFFGAEAIPYVEA